MWGALIGLGAGALMGKMKADQERKNIEAMNRAASEQTRYSWASGGPMGQIQGIPSAWGSMLQGGMSGAMVGSQFGGADAAKPAATEATAAKAAAPARMFSAAPMTSAMPQPQPFNSFEDILNQNQKMSLNPDLMSQTKWGQLANR